MTDDYFACPEIDIYVMRVHPARWAGPDILDMVYWALSSPSPPSFDPGGVADQAATTADMIAIARGWFSRLEEAELKKRNG
jgi:hypothetical protein